MWDVLRGRFGFTKEDYLEGTVKGRSRSSSRSSSKSEKSTKSSSSKKTSKTDKKGKTGRESEATQVKGILKNGQRSSRQSQTTGRVVLTVSE